MKENLKKWANQLKTDIPAIFLSLRDEQTPLGAKIMAGITVHMHFRPLTWCQTSYRFWDIWMM